MIHTFPLPVRPATVTAGTQESVYRLLEYGAAAPGALLGGPLATQLGLTLPFWFGAIAGVLLIPVIWPAFSRGAIGVGFQVGRSR